MRVHAYHLDAELYRELEGQILEELKEGDRQALTYILEEASADIELLSGEWGVLFAAASENFQHVDLKERIARMAVSPDELEDFVDLLHEPRNVQSWQPIAFGMAELRHLLEPGEAQGALVFMEESDDWLWAEHPYEIMAIRPEVYELIAPQVRKLVLARDYSALARLIADHCEGAIELAKERWNRLHEDAQARAPKLVEAIEGMLTKPDDYPQIREHIAAVSDAAVQPSLDAWLRVHAHSAEYGLFFRDVVRERS